MSPYSARREHSSETEIQFTFVKSGNPLQLPGTIIATTLAFAPRWNMQKSVRTLTSRICSLRNYMYVQRNTLKFSVKKLQAFKLKMWDARITQQLKISSKRIYALRFRLNIFYINFFLIKISILKNLETVARIKAVKYISWQNDKLNWSEHNNIHKLKLQCNIQQRDDRYFKKIFSFAVLL